MDAPRVLWILGCAFIASALGSRLKTPALPIQPEREPMISKGLSGCSFGGRFYSLEDTWHPDLGEPFGVMHCVMCHCEPCPKGDSGRKEAESLFEFFQEKDDDLHKSYNDRSYISSEENSNRDSATDFVAVLTGVTDSWLPSSSGVARARFTLARTSLTFSITLQRMNRPSVITFLDSDGNTAFEFRVPRVDTDMGKVIKHRALFAETFSAILTSDEVHSGMGGIAMLTLSDTENNLHFILILQGLVPHGSCKDKEIIQMIYIYIYEEFRCKSMEDSDLAEVLADLNSRELFWLSRGQLQISVETEGQNPRQISGYISGKRSCDTLQSVMSSGSALTPGKTGGVGSAVFTLHHNGSLDYQVLVAGLSSTVVGVTIGGRALGSCSRVEARHIHMLLQNELFINIATAEQQESELRGQIRMLPYNGLDARRNVYVNAHLHGLAEIGEMDDSSTNHKRLLTGFYGQQAQGVLKKTVICDPVICPALSCPHTIQPEDHCCPICDEKKETKQMTAVEKVEEDPEGCYFEGDQKMHAPGTTWHPFVPPFGYIKCAVCTCKGSTGEVHCEKVTCPPLTCSRPIRRNPSDCCKECPAEDTPPLEDDEMMQADGARHCKFGNNYYQNSEHWHPRVPLVGEMKCITCWCDHGVTKCQKKQCPFLSCSNPIRREGKCCPECIEDFMEKEEMAKMVEKKKNWRH
ncbi:chordin-like [Sinocyclocheilus anshuiensis]|uniref:chordin-like n=1 Tax=Sinocyclocheilus anshuiensis TaxID=1608454 RepID=UPI0007BABC68|nr:PREDICTED: chordin-like [Sinocyclocheilus anshuiensis]